MVGMWWKNSTKDSGTDDRDIIFTLHTIIITYNYVRNTPLYSLVLHTYIHTCERAYHTLADWAFKSILYSTVNTAESPRADNLPAYFTVL